MIITSLQNKFWFIYLYKLTYTDIATLDLDTTEIGLTRSSICFGGGPARKTRDGRLSSGAQVLHTKLLEATNLCLLVRCSPMFSSLNCPASCTQNVLILISLAQDPKTKKPSRCRKWLYCVCQVCVWHQTGGLWHQGESFNKNAQWGIKSFEYLDHKERLKTLIF